MLQSANGVVDPHPKRKLRFGRRRRIVAALAIVGLLAAAWAYAVAVRNPVVRQARVALPGWPAEAAPLRVVLVSDVHVAGPDMPPERLARIVAQINALRPDLVLLAGDFNGDKPVATRSYPFPVALAPLAGLRPRLGSYAVLGNHDHWTDPAAATAALTAAGVRVLSNDAVRVGPLALGGIDDAYTDHADLPGTISAMQTLGGVPVLLSHSPDPFADLPADVPLMLAGHTHCGQIRLPLIGAVTYESRYGARFGCGRIEEGGRTLFVGAGLGTSVVPLRLGAAPELWLLELGSP